MSLGYLLDTTVRADKVGMVGMVRKVGNKKDREETHEVFKEALGRDKQKKIRRKKKRAIKTMNNHKERWHCADMGVVGPSHFHPLFPPVCQPTPRPGPL